MTFCCTPWISIYVGQGVYPHLTAARKADVCDMYMNVCWCSFLPRILYIVVYNSPRLNCALYIQFSCVLFSVVLVPLQQETRVRFSRKTYIW